MKAQTLYFKITDSKGRSRIEGREVWDRDRFFTSITKQYADQKDDPSKVEIATRKDYLKQIKRK